MPLNIIVKDNAGIVLMDLRQKKHQQYIYIYIYMYVYKSPLESRREWNEIITKRPSQCASNFLVQASKI